MSSEDFSWYMTKKPGAIFRFGTRNEEKGCTALGHHSDFRIDEDGMRAGVEAFVAFALHYGE
jgi:metal-dependent amidase/aminoacylase/carboxypeptidase family protein